jgi:signal transduction histidine kinase
LTNKSKNSNQSGYVPCSSESPTSPKGEVSPHNFIPFGLGGGSPVECDLIKLTQEIVDIFHFRVENKQQQFTVKIDPYIPKTFICDNRRFTHLITNLIENAVKFTGEGGSITLDMRYMGEQDGIRTIQITVADTGIGISGKQQKRLFRFLSHYSHNS